MPVEQSLKMPMLPKKGHNAESGEITATDQSDKETKSSKRKRAEYALLLSGLIAVSAVAVGFVALVFQPSPTPPKCRTESPQPGYVRVLASHPEGNKIRWWIAQDGQGLRTFTCPIGNCSNQTFSDVQNYLVAETVLAVTWDETVTPPQEIWASTSSKSEGKLFNLVKQNNIWKQTGDKIGQPYCPASKIAIRSDKLFLGPVDADQGKLYSFDGKRWSDSQILNIPERTRLQVKSLVTSQYTEELWVGSTVGLYRIGEGQLGQSLRPPWVKTTLFSIESLAIDHNTLWVGTTEYGLVHFNSVQGAWKQIEGLPSSRIIAISLSASKKTALVGTDHGLGICTWNKNYETRCSRVDDLRVQGKIDAVRLDANGTAFVGASEGMVLMNLHFN